MMPYIPDYNENWKNFWQWVVLTLIATIIFIIVLGFILSVGAMAEQEPDWDKLVPIIIQIESSGNPIAISKDGCIGLMQISPMVLEEWQQSQNWIKKNANNMGYLLFDEKWNIQIGTWYLKRIWFHYLPHYKIPQMIDNLLWAYNAGIGNVVKGIKPKETRNYIKRYYQLSKGR